MNCKFDIAVHQVPAKMQDFETASDGLRALEGLIECGAIRISDRNQATVKALRSALDERWTMLQQYKQAAQAEVIRAHGLPFPEQANS